MISIESNMNREDQNKEEIHTVELLDGYKSYQISIFKEPDKLYIECHDKKDKSKFYSYQYPLEEIKKDIGYNNINQAFEIFKKFDRNNYKIKNQDYFLIELKISEGEEIKLILEENTKEEEEET